MAAEQETQAEPVLGTARGTRRAYSSRGCRCPECRAAKAAYDAAYNAAHREEKRAYDAAYYAAHREEKRAYYQAHRERALDWAAEYYRRPGGYLKKMMYNREYNRPAALAADARLMERYKEGLREFAKGQE
jgi:hypothetical protein